VGRRKWFHQSGYAGTDICLIFQGPIYYMAGPPAMGGAMRQMLITAGADEDDLRAEEFSGY
jgi:hypothetical protein